MSSGRGWNRCCLCPRGRVGRRRGRNGRPTTTPQELRPPRPPPSQVQPGRLPSTARRRMRNPPNSTGSESRRGPAECSYFRGSRGRHGHGRGKHRVGIDLTHTAIFRPPSRVRSASPSGSARPDKDASGLYQSVSGHWSALPIAEETATKPTAVFVPSPRPTCSSVRPGAQRMEIGRITPVGVSSSRPARRDPGLPMPPRSPLPPPRVTACA